MIKDGRSPSLRSGSGCQSSGPQPPSASSQSGIPNADLSGYTDEALTAAAERARRLIRALSAASFADLCVARDEPASEASDRVLSRGFMQEQAAKRVLLRIESEISRRADAPNPEEQPK